MRNFSIALLFAITSVLTACGPGRSVDKSGGPSAPVYTEEQKNLGAQLVGAVHQGDVDQVRSLIEKGAPVDYAHKPEPSITIRGARIAGMTITPLQVAVLADRADLVNLLLEKGARVNMTNDRGYSALAFAANQGNADLSVLLISKGAMDQGSAAENGSIVAFAALWPQKLTRKVADEDKARARILTAIQQRGVAVDLNRPSSTGATALMASVYVNSPGNEMARKLIAWGANINATHTTNGESAVHWAIAGLLGQGHAQSKPNLAKALPKNSHLHLLVAAKADLKIRNKRGQTPLAFARSFKASTLRNDIIKLLRKSGASE